MGPLHDWYFNGDHPLVDEDHADVHGAPFRVSAASADYVRGLWSRQKVLVIGRHQFDLTNGWEGHPPASDHVVVVSHRPRPPAWHPESSYHFASSVEEGMARAQELAGGHSRAASPSNGHRPTRPTPRPCGNQSPAPATLVPLGTG